MMRATVLLLAAVSAATIGRGVAAQAVEPPAATFAPAAAPAFPPPALARTDSLGAAGRPLAPLALRPRVPGADAAAWPGLVAPTAREAAGASRGRYVRRGALAGALVGTATMLVTYYSCDDACGGDAAEILGLVVGTGVVVGGGVGAGVGWLLHRVRH